MFIGHFAIAFVLAGIFPQVPILVPLIAVSFPDLLWPLLVLAGIEKVRIDRDSPLQMNIVALVFVIGSASHWVLDFIVHLPDLPMLGFGKMDKKFGFGLWRHGPLAFLVEFIFYAAVTISILPGNLVPGVLLLGGIFHLVNANSFFGLTCCVA